MPAERHPGLVVDVRAGERLKFSGEATLELLYKSGTTARLRVIAPKSVQIVRIEGEIHKPNATKTQPGS